MNALTDPLLDGVLKGAIFPALTHLPPKMSSPDAWHIMLAIGLQESGLTERAQILNGGGKGPARGLWQNERGGGVVGVLTHPLTRLRAWDLCHARGVDPVSQAVWERLETDDVLAAGFARLLLWTDPLPLPTRKGVDAGWDLYAKRLWRPGKPHPDRWPANFERAGRFIYGE